GRIDAVECTAANARVREWYRAWSAGIRFPLAGASGKDSNATALGAMRTYAQLPPETPLTLGNWIDAVRAGRTFVTSGPLLRFTVDEQAPGALLERAADSSPLKVRASVESATSAGPLEIIANGEVIARASGSEILIEHALPAGGWLAARCLAAPQCDGFAHTSPLFVRVNGRLPADADVCREYSDSLERTIDWANTLGR